MYTIDYDSEGWVQADTGHQFELYNNLNDDWEVVLTGGRATGDTKITVVTKYNMQGTATYLPSLNTGRSYHACGKFRKTDGSVVNHVS